MPGCVENAPVMIFIDPFRNLRSSLFAQLCAEKKVNTNVLCDRKIDCSVWNCTEPESRTEDVITVLLWWYGVLWFETGWLMIGWKDVQQIIIIIIVYYARRQQNHTDKTPKTQNYTTVYK